MLHIKLSIYSFIYVYRLRIFYFIYWVIIYCCHLFQCSNCLLFVPASPFKVASVSFWHISIILSVLLCFGSIRRFFQAHLVLPLSQPWNQPLIQRVRVPSEGNSVLMPRYAHCYWGGTTPRLSQWTELGTELRNTCMYTHTHTHTHTHTPFTSIFISVSIYTYWKPWVHTDTSQHPNSNWAPQDWILVFFLFCMCW